MFPLYIEEIIIIMEPDMSNLPTEVQQQIASLMGTTAASIISRRAELASAPAPAAQAPPPPAVAPGSELATSPMRQPPSLMEHIVALREEVHFLHAQVQTLNQQISAVAKVSEASGRALAEIYNIFVGSPEQGAPTSGTDEF